ncbi:hypothetical protein BS50DRAFT_186170 [Corynespora cassiicola Philippines]|uniref:Uncharacterized protein n=1 Tax=Corynespora cassiicola Philippines TaxID=1448308 RepID=A0A2T2P6T8_CORCC|nr:hypothetical protein BS50DRAFT_186170 [Corynespora cassiicola Philippines]
MSTKNTFTLSVRRKSPAHDVPSSEMAPTTLQSPPETRSQCPTLRRTMRSSSSAVRTASLRERIGMKRTHTAPTEIGKFEASPVDTTQRQGPTGLSRMYTAPTSTQDPMRGLAKTPGLKKDTNSESLISKPDPGDVLVVSHPMPGEILGVSDAEEDEDLALVRDKYKPGALKKPARDGGMLAGSAKVDLVVDTPVRERSQSVTPQYDQETCKASQLGETDESEEDKIIPSGSRPETKTIPAENDIPESEAVSKGAGSRLTGAIQSAVAIGVTVAVYAFT